MTAPIKLTLDATEYTAGMRAAADKVIHKYRWRIRARMIAAFLLGTIVPSTIVAIYTLLTR